MARQYEWEAVITNAELVKINGKRCVKAKFATSITQPNGVALNLKGQTFNIGPVKRIVKQEAGMTVFTAMGRYTVVGDIKKGKKRK